ncbi:hypothetical protein P879_04593 [Paragonimus westermani]|uniref:Secreted peptide n=1 Tax=Paragonimus westermani TaxID=34504 RepID=A0A8T0DUJ6_9TREM|nr:hypothetical protein P879_04593 [Paragonimus westermani]
MHATNMRDWCTRISRLFLMFLCLINLMVCCATHCCLSNVILFSPNAYTIARLLVWLLVGDKLLSVNV